MLKAWHAAMVQNQDDIVNIMVMECGKPVKEAQNEVTAGLASVEWFAEESKRCCFPAIASPQLGHPLHLKAPMCHHSPSTGEQSRAANVTDWHIIYIDTSAVGTMPLEQPTLA